MLNSVLYSGEILNLNNIIYIYKQKFNYINLFINYETITDILNYNKKFQFFELPIININYFFKKNIYIYLFLINNFYFENIFIVQYKYLNIYKYFISKLKIITTTIFGYLYDDFILDIIIDIVFSKNYLNNLIKNYLKNVFILMFFKFYSFKKIKSKHFLHKNIHIIYLKCIFVVKNFYKNFYFNFFCVKIYNNNI